MIERTYTTRLQCTGCGVSKIVNADKAQDKAKIITDFRELHAKCDAGSKQQDVEGGK